MYIDAHEPASMHKIHVLPVYPTYIQTCSVRWSGHVSLLLPPHFMADNTSLLQRRDMIHTVCFCQGYALVCCVFGEHFYQ